MENLKFRAKKYIAGKLNHISGYGQRECELDQQEIERIVLCMILLKQQKAEKETEK